MSGMLIYLPVASTEVNPERAAFVQDRSAHRLGSFLGEKRGPRLEEVGMGSVSTGLCFKVRD